MKNKYEIKGDITEIFLRRMNGEVIVTTIQTDDLPRAMEFKYTWFAIWRKDTNSFYVQGKNDGDDGRKISVYLHRWITSAPKELQVDHINHDTLDNRRSNLRFVTNAQNRQNLKGAHRDSKSGVRGVSWHTKNRKWIVHVQVGGKVRHLGCFDNKLEAERVAVESRSKLMPFSQDAKAAR